LFDFFRASAAALAGKQSSAPELIDDPGLRRGSIGTIRQELALLWITRLDGGPLGP